MRSKALVIVLVAGLGLGAAGCDRIKRKLAGKPSGQVVATVNGEEITSLELRNEMSGFSTSDPKLQKIAQDQALEQIIVRNLLAQKARKEKLDKFPAFNVQVNRGERILLAQMYESRLFGKVAAPTRREAETYIAAHPEQFANRRIYIIDRMVAPSAHVTEAQVAAVGSIEQLRSMLDAQSAPYQQSVVVVDTLTADPGTAQGIANVPVGQVFVYKQGGALVFNRLIDTRQAPIRGEPAIDVAQNQLRKDQGQDFLRSQVIGLRREADANIIYANGYKPSAPVVAPVTMGQGSGEAPAPAAQ
jgi:EpsD family peptidyl-prolyl cis-trans isomerase